MKRCHILVQTRTASTRLPNKCFLPLKGKPFICRILDRLEEVEEASLLGVVLPDTRGNDSLEKLLIETRTPYFRGPEDDVLKRYQTAAEHFKSDIIVRVTGDNPFIHTESIDSMIRSHVSNAVDYTTTGGLPIGSGSEVISRDCLMSLDKYPLTARDREHVTIYIRENPAKFKVQTINVQGHLKRPSLRLTVDEKKDYEIANTIYNSFESVKCIPLEDVIDFIDKHPEILNSQVK